MAINIPQALLNKWPLFVKAGATKPCTYKSMGNSNYTPGNQVTNPILSSTPLEIIFDDIKAFLVDDVSIFSIDKTAIFPVLLLSSIPKINDLIVGPDASKWKVIRIVVDPANACYQLQVRPSNG